MFHAIGPNGEAVFNLNCPDGPAELRENYRLPARELAMAERAVNRHTHELCRTWEGMHGDA